jgi:hypothetical protein
MAPTAVHLSVCTDYHKGPPAQGRYVVTLLEWTMHTLTLQSGLVPRTAMVFSLAAREPLVSIRCLSSMCQAATSLQIASIGMVARQ